MLDNLRGGSSSLYHQDTPKKSMQHEFHMWPSSLVYLNHCVEQAKANGVYNTKYTIS